MIDPAAIVPKPRPTAVAVLAGLPLLLAAAFATPAAAQAQAPAQPQPQAAPAEPVEDPRIAEARAACLSGDYPKGVRLLTDLYLATTDAVWIFNQGRCFQQNGQASQALARFKEYLRKAKDAAPEDIKEAEGYVKELEAELGRGASTAGDGEASGPSGRVSPEGSAATPAAAAGESPRRALSRLQVTGIVLGSVGVAAIGAGAFFSLKVQSTEREVDGIVRGESVLEYDSKLKANERAGARYELLQWISYGVGIAALAAGAATFYVGRSGAGADDRVALSITPVLAPGAALTSVRASF
jgi:hypothetical protein